MGATIYTCIAGTPPQAGDQREEKDKMIPLKTLAKSGWSDEIIQIVNDCLELDWFKRLQTVFDL